MKMIKTLLISLILFLLFIPQAFAMPYGEFAHIRGDAIVVRVNGTNTQMDGPGDFDYTAPNGFSMLPNMYLGVGESLEYTFILADNTEITGFLSSEYIWFNQSIPGGSVNETIPFAVKANMSMGSVSDNESFLNLYGDIEYCVAMTTIPGSTNGHIIIFAANNNQVRGIPNENTPIVYYNLSNVKSQYIKRVITDPDGDYTVGYSIYLVNMSNYYNNVDTTQNNYGWDKMFSDITRDIGYYIGILTDIAAVSITAVIEIFGLFKFIFIDNLEITILMYFAVTLFLSVNNSKNIFQASSKFINYQVMFFTFIINMIMWIISIVQMIIAGIRALWPL
jgi:hypothetical protein